MSQSEVAIPGGLERGGASGIPRAWLRWAYTTSNTFLYGMGVLTQGAKGPVALGTKAE